MDEVADRTRGGGGGRREGFGDFGLQTGRGGGEATVGERMGERLGKSLELGEFIWVFMGEIRAGRVTGFF